MSSVALNRATSPVAFPLVTSENRRYLTDSKGNPFPILGRTAWFVLSLPKADAEYFLTDTVRRGHNAVEFSAINHDARGKDAPFNGNGDLPFLKRVDGKPWNGSLTQMPLESAAPDFTTPNEKYWRFVDDFVDDCGVKGIAAFMFPAYVGYAGGEQGWMREMVANGPDRMRSYGAWISKRYQKSKNIVWMAGGDLGVFNPGQKEVEAALLEGIASVKDRQSIHCTAEWDSGMNGTDQADFGRYMTLNSVYSWTGDIPAMGRRAYAHEPAMPAFLLEEPYDEEGPDGNSANPNATQPVRRFQWWGWLTTIGGYISGNGYVWPFAGGLWREHLDTQGARDMARLNTFVKSIPWWRLTPCGLAGTKTVIKQGVGQPSEPGYIASAVTTEGDLFVAYLPPAHPGSMTIDMGALPKVNRGRWFDPTSGSYQPIDISPSTAGTFLPPGKNSRGDNDWVLILDASSH